MAIDTIDGIVSEATVNFVGKDGFYWWVGEVEDHEDPMKLGRVRCRVLGYYTNVQGGTTSDLPTKFLPWATVLQTTAQSGNDKQGESSGQLQPGAIVMGFFMDGDNAQMPIVIGVLRVQKSDKTKKTKKFAFTGQDMEPGIAPNPAATHPLFPNSSNATTEEEGYSKDSNTSVNIPSDDTDGDGEEPNGPQSPNNLTNKGVGKLAPKIGDKPRPAANGVGGPWKTLEYQLQYLVEDLADSASTLIKAEDGDFLDVVSGKLVKAKELTVKIQNFLGAVFAQVVSAMRQALANLADELKLVSILGSKTGAPMVIFGIIQSAVKLILSALCNLDSNIMKFISDPMSFITDKLDSLLEGLIDKAAFVLQSVQKTIDGIVCNVQSMIDSVISVVSKVTTIVDAVGKAKDIIDTWKKGTKIFADGFDLIKNGKASITGIISMIIGFLASDCGRKPDGGNDTVGWYPLLGVTHCTPEELKAIENIRGGGRQSCDGGKAKESGSLFDNLIKQADPYLTAAKTFLDGSYELHIGNPGGQIEQKRNASGTLHFSINSNTQRRAIAAAEKQIREEEEKSGEKMSDADRKALIAKTVKAYNTTTNSPTVENKGDRGNLVADHITWAGNRTQDVKGDDCIDIENDKVETIHGDYFLDVTGDCHLTVGGGFFMNAQGSPKLVNKRGESVREKIQKHTINFGSDVDIASAGAKITFQGAELDIGSQSTKITGSSMECSSTVQKYAGGEILIAGDNSIELFTTSLYNIINVPSIGPSALAGIRTICKGSIETVMMPGGSATDAIPRWVLANPTGPMVITCGATGYSNTVLGGAFNANAAGAIIMTSGAATTIASGAAITMTATATIKLLAATIFLN
tara:strand:- start:249 stop:2828 length:2580 start_codon:yes stop_codon:yes gene_type:complete